MLRLLQLTSPSLPIGAFAYSQGLECAAREGWVEDDRTLADWLSGLLSHCVARVDVPILARSYHAWQIGDVPRVRFYARYLHALRETRERELEERQMGRSLARCLNALGIDSAKEWIGSDVACVPSLFALAAVRWQIGLRAAATGYMMAWAQNQVSAALRLLPVGQLAGQQVLASLLGVIPSAADVGLALEDDDIGFSAPAQALACALHETQYSRLFRS